MDCPKCNSNSVHIAEDEPKCMTCGWNGFKGIDQDTARKEVEREARKMRQMRGRKQNYVY